MRGRLFWKILLGFWLTFIIMTQALWVAFSLYGDRYEPPENAMARRVIT
ncbi:MAG: sensor histidine kinase, partial [Serratia proteamaculans]